MNRELFWIWLSLGLTPGSRSCKRILERFRTPEEFFRAPDDQWRSFRLPAGELSALSTRDLVQAEKISAACREKGVLVIKAKDKLRLLPALNIPMGQLAKAIAVIKECCAG